MKLYLWVRNLLLLALVSLHVSCMVAEQRTFLHIQLCLADESGIAAFKDTMRHIAQENGMEYVDGSEATQMRSAKLNIAQDYPIVHIGATATDDSGFHILSLSEFEVVVAFRYGTNADGARQFAGNVVARLRDEWTVHVVPPDRGALPLGNCPSASD